jgi:Dolichyl-phosphate-mannose-protein mannosyltransferase
MTRPARVDATTAESGLERWPATAGWLDAHAKILVPAVLAAGFLLRVRLAARLFLSPDEALHYALVHQASLAAVYRASLHEAHPPLFFFLLYFWSWLGRSELLLRAPSLVAGTIAAWAVYKWLREIFGARAAWIGLLLFCFAPKMVAMSAEVRDYAVLLLVMAGALYFLESALERQSAPRMALFGLFLLLAVLTDYSALWFAIAVGIYAMVRIARQRAPRALVVTWLGSQLAAAAAYAFLYFTHIAKLRTSSLALQARYGWLSQFYFHPGKDSLLAFTLGNTMLVFRYVFSSNEAAIPLLVAFLLGVILLLDPKAQPSGRPPARPLALLLVLPFIANCGGALAGVFPYGGSRQEIYLALFAVAGISYALARLGGRAVWPGLAATAAILLLTNLRPVAPTSIRAEYLAHDWMTGALGAMHRDVPAGSLVFSDYQSTLVLGYYLCPGQPFPFATLERHMGEFPCGGYRIVSNSRDEQVCAIEYFPRDLEQIASRYRVKPGQSLWAFHAAADTDLVRNLEKRYPQLRFPAEHPFGANVVVYQVVVPPVESGTRQ